MSSWDTGFLLENVWVHVFKARLSLVWMPALFFGVFLHTCEAVGKRCCLLSIINWEIKGLRFSKNYWNQVFFMFSDMDESLFHTFMVYLLFECLIFFSLCVCAFMHMKACKQIWLGLYDDRNLAIPDFREPQKVKEFLQDKYEKKRWWGRAQTEMFIVMFDIWGIMNSQSLLLKTKPLHKVGCTLSLLLHDYIVHTN